MPTTMAPLMNAMMPRRTNRQKKCPPPRYKRCMNERESPSLPSTSRMPPFMNALPTSATNPTPIIDAIRNANGAISWYLLRSAKVPRLNRVNSDSVSTRVSSAVPNHARAGMTAAIPSSRFQAHNSRTSLGFFSVVQMPLTMLVIMIDVSSSGATDPATR
jgi:hypothetical protein